MRSQPWLSAWPCLLLALLVACSEKKSATGPTEEDLGTYFQDLPSWSEFSPLGEPVAPTPTGAAQQLPDTVLDLYQISSAGVDTTHDVTYSCVSVPYTMSDNPQKIVMYSPDREILWPGALIQGKSYRDGLGSLLGLPIAERAPINVSIPGLPTQDNYRAVENPNQATVSQAIGSMLGNATADGLSAPSSIDFKLEDYNSEKQFALAAGVSGRYLGFSASASTSVERTAAEHTVAAQFTQKMFEVVVEPPQTPDAFFSADFTQDKLQQQIDLGRIGPGNVPVYVSNVVYGRMMMFALTSTANETDIRATMQAGYSNAFGSINAEVEAKYKNILQHSKIAVTSLGGSGDATLAMIRSGDWSQYFTDSAPLSSAAPLTYTFRSFDGSIAMVTEATNYNMKICQPKVAGEGGLWYKDEQLQQLDISTPVRPVPGDYNGDGRTDLAFNHLATDGNDIEVLFGSSDGTFQAAASTSSHPSAGPHGWGNYDVKSGDVNGDGRADLIWNYRGETDNLTYVGLSDGTGGFTYPDSTAHWAVNGWAWDNGKCTFDVADVNGDGRDDIIWSCNFPGGPIRLYTGLAQSDGSFYLPSFKDAAGRSYSSYDIADVDGDGMADFVAVSAGGSAATVGVGHSLGDGDFNWDWGTNVNGDYQSARTLPGEFDGRYGTDNVWARVDGDSVRLNVLLAKETNDNLAPTSTAVTEGPAADNLAVLVVDLNGDGRDDVIVNDRSTNKSWVGLADPNGVLKFGEGSQQHPSTYVTWTNFETLTGDVDGDGRGDVIWVHPASPARIYVGLGN